MSSEETEIVRVQNSLKQEYSIEKYNKAIEKLISKTNDAEVLAHMAEDMQLTPHERLFAVAAMGEL